MLPVQGSHVERPASRDAFGSLGALTALTSLKMEAMLRVNPLLLKNAQQCSVADASVAQAYRGELGEASTCRSLDRTCQAARTGHHAGLAGLLGAESVVQCYVHPSLCSNNIGQRSCMHTVNTKSCVLAPTDSSYIHCCDATQVTELKHITSSMTRLTSVHAGTTLPAGCCPWRGVPMSATTFTRTMQIRLLHFIWITAQEALLDAGAIDDAGKWALPLADFVAAVQILVNPMTDGGLQASKHYHHEMLVRLNKLHARMEPSKADQLAK